MDSLLFFFAGSLVSWLIAMVYYRKSCVKAPEWAHPLIKSLPNQPISKDDLIKIIDKKIETMVIDGGNF